MTNTPRHSSFNKTLLFATLALAALGFFVGPLYQKGNTPIAVAASSASVAVYDNSKTHTAIFAGGCFWCVESDFDHVPGVISTTSGYIGGTTPNPTYEMVSYGNTGHREAVKIIFDPEKTSYKKLLDVFWRSIDPTDAGGQFCDRGESYKTGIFATSEAQLKIALMSRKELDDAKRLKAPIATLIRRAGTFTDAEGYHQDYYTKHPVQYKFYRYRCGRDARIKQLWGNEAHAGISEH